MNIRSEMIVPANDNGISESRTQSYLYHDRPVREECRSYTGESDFSNQIYTRISEDNGKTWGEWKDVYSDSYEAYGEHERTIYGNRANIWNSVHKHYVCTGMDRVYINGHVEAYKNYWSGKGMSFYDHVYLRVREENDDESKSYLVKYEDGAEFDSQNVLNTEYLYKNKAYLSYPEVQTNGDIIFPICGIPIEYCCNKLGLDINEVFPSCPQLMGGMIIVKGIWDKDKGEYELHFSRPIMISDLKSSRCICEPVTSRLKSGRIVCVFRGSNYATEDWNTRIEPGTPGFKWFTYSDDDGKTFTEPVPLHFDDREVVYSSSSIPYYIRSAKNDKLYWIGNITDHTAYGNYPRFPLFICEVDDKYGTLIKSTLTMIDTRHEDESDMVQLSNFTVLEDFETKNLEIYLTKYGQYYHTKNNVYICESWRYFIEI